MPALSTAKPRGDEKPAFAPTPSALPAMLSVPASKLIPNAGFTVSVAPALVTVPPALLTATLYTLAVSGNCGEEMAYVTALAPATSIPLRFH